MVASYTIQYTFSQGQRIIQSEISCFASSEQRAIQNVTDEVMRRFGSPVDLRIHVISAPLLAK